MPYIQFKSIVLLNSHLLQFGRKNASQSHTQTKSFISTALPEYEPYDEKTNNVVSEQV